MKMKHIRNVWEVMAAVCVSLFFVHFLHGVSHKTAIKCYRKNKCAKEKKHSKKYNTTIVRMRETLNKAMHFTFTWCKRGSFLLSSVARSVSALLLASVQNDVII